MNVFVNDYVYSLSKGLGIVQDITQIGSNVMYKLKFKNEEVIDHNQDKEYSFLSKNFVSYIVSKEFEKDFSDASFKRGEEYHNNKKIISFSISDNLFKGIVEGERNYSVFISSNDNGKVSMECTCPFGFKCKHEAAFLLFIADYLKRSINELNGEKVDNRKISKQELSYDSSLIKEIKQICSGFENYSYVEALFRLNERFKRFSDYDFVSFLTDIYRYRELKNINDFIQLVLLNIENVSTILKNTKYEVGVYFTTKYREIQSNQNQRYHITFYSDERIEIIKRINKNDYNGLLEFIYDINARNSLSPAIIEYIIDYIDVNDKNTIILVNLQRFMNKYYLKTLVPYIKKCDFESLRMFAKIVKGVDLITVDELDNIEDDTIFTALGKINDEVAGIKYVIKNIEKLFKINKLSTILVLRTFILEIESYDKKIKMLEEINKCDLVRPYLGLISNSFSKRTIEKEVEIDEDKDFSDFEIDYYNDLLNIFDIKFSIYSTEKVFVKSYKVFVNFFNKSEEVLGFNEKNGKLVINCDLLESKVDENLINYIYQYLENENKDKINEEYKVFHEKNLLYKDRENDSKVLSGIESFIERMKEVDAPILFDDDKVNLEYHFINLYGKTYLSLRVGSSKMYAVQNVNRFFNNVKEASYDKYGKSYGFFHSINNFNEPHNNILKFLMNTFKDDELNNKYLLITKDIAQELFTLLDKEIVYYTTNENDNNDKQFLVTLNEFEYKINIDNELTLTLNSEESDYDIVEGLNSDFIFINGEVKAINNDLVKKELFNFASLNNGYRVKNNLDSFISEVYLRKPEIFNLDESVKEIFEANLVTINLYFDFVDKNITVNRKMYKGDIINQEQISEEELSGRDKARLSKINSILENLGFEENNGLKISREDKVLNFFKTDLAMLKKEANVYLSDSITSKKVIGFPKNEYRIQYNNELMTIFMKESVFSREELQEIYNKIKRKKKFVLLKNDTIVNIDNEEAQKFEQIVNDFHLDTSDLTKPTAIPIYQSLKAYAYENEIEYDDYVGDMIKKIAAFKDYDLGEFALKNTLRGYQLDGVKWLTILSKYHLGGILADDMGLGKTLQFIALFQVNSKKKPSLVVCPKTLIFNWKNEFKKFYPEMKVIEVYGLANERETIINTIDPNKRVVYITSYDSLRNDIELYTQEFEYIVLDEAQVIKNVQALKSQSVKKLKGEVKFALTGTPIENNILDLWSIFDFILPAYFNEIGDFKDKYEHDENYVSFIAKKISPFILRRCKKDVLKDLPAKYERIMTVEMNEEQAKLYESFVLQAKELLQSGSSAFECLQYLMRLRQICVSPSMFLESYSGESAKMEYLKENLGDMIEKGHKILIFSQFVSALREIEIILNDLGIKYFMLTGDTKAIDRIELCNKFNKADSIEKVFLISLKAGGNGINLVGADKVIHMDPWWNVSAENQATDRAHRIGQNKNVEVIKLIVEDSIEQRVIELQNIKKDLIDKVISNDETSITKLTIDDLKFILS